MIKIKSIVDVITNSSTEVFILKTDKSLKDISEWIKKESIEGLRKPKKIKDKKGILNTLVEFGDLYNPDDSYSINKYRLEILSVYKKYDYDKMEDIVYEDRKEIHKSWIKFLKRNINRIVDHLEKRHGFCKPREWVENEINDDELDDFVFTFPEYLPDDFLKEFLDSYKGSRPEGLDRIPPELDVNSYIGCVELMGEHDNSVKYEDFDKINKKFNGENYHLG